MTLIQAMGQCNKTEFVEVALAILKSLIELLSPDLSCKSRLIQTEIAPNLEQCWCGTSACLSTWTIPKKHIPIYFRCCLSAQKCPATKLVTTFSNLFVFCRAIANIMLSYLIEFVLLNLFCLPKKNGIYSYLY